jgi:penicillin-binding protein-related factor A (putative recombinase)
LSFSYLKEAQKYQGLSFLLVQKRQAGEMLRRKAGEWQQAMGNKQ